ncbi:serine carboxypeptidase-like 7 [Punica granatum]|uniref:Serine carboxypeptidase-like 7 n=2 Tax=Punica granatum TaxID=22663 RepID=A0A6P8C2Q2_PUNGR|nr:serine carboxypeptidase-like 7 [Punica granatum]PKI72459.1 hypothetical protein CRG98_007126 [Punica granatum]
MAIGSRGSGTSMPALLLLLLLLLPLVLLQVVSRSTVEFLPGFDGPLPFHLETGYVGVGVGEREEIQLFYYFIKSERNAEEDPLMVWLTGGPGCSAFSGLAYEIGPLNFKIKEYINDSLPELVYNPYSWTKASSIIFVDAPVGTGFSYATKASAYRTGDFEQVRDLNNFIRKWLIRHPKFMSSPLYVGGDSYSGFTVPALVQAIINGNEEGRKPYVNIKGYLLGNPVTDPVIDGNSPIPYAHGMGLISDELYEALQKSCKGQYRFFDPSNVDCLRNIQSYYQCIIGLQTAQILEPLCGFASPKPPVQGEALGKVRFLIEQVFRDNPPAPVVPDLGCRAYGYTLAPKWTNDENVRKALHIRKGSVGTWQRCAFGLPYTSEITSSLQYHANLSKQGCRSLIYSGDHDMIVPFLGTQAWIRSLNYSIVDDWRPWMVGAQIGGYTRTYANQMTFATVKGGGHTAPEYRPEECSAMYKRWISEEPL